MKYSEQISDKHLHKLSHSSAADGDGAQKSKDEYLAELSFLNKRACWQAASKAEA